MNTSTAEQGLIWFRRIDRVFWLAWVGLAFMVWAVHAAGTDPSLEAQLPPEQAACAKLLPLPGRMSPAGQVIFWSLFAFQVSIYVVLLGFLHAMVRRFAGGRVFVGETLASLQWLGVILIAWPFIERIAENGAGAVLKARGDIAVFVPTYAIDVAPIAVGVFLIALRHVLQHAITIKAEHDLTV